MGPGGASVGLAGSQRPEAALAGPEGVAPGAGSRIPAGGSGFPTPASPCQQHPQLEEWAGGSGAGRGQAVGFGARPSPGLFLAVCPPAPGSPSLRLGLLLGEAPGEAQRPCPQRPAQARSPRGSLTHTSRRLSLQPRGVGRARPGTETRPAACDENGASAGPRDAGRARHQPGAARRRAAPGTVGADGAGFA